MCFGIIYMIENSRLIGWWLSDWLIETLEAVIRSCSSKYVFLKISQISQENTCVGVLWGLQLYQKETPTQMVSCEIYKIFRNTFFTEHLQWLLLTLCVLKLFNEVYFCFPWTENNSIPHFSLFDYLDMKLTFPHNILFVQCRLFISMFVYKKKEKMCGEKKTVLHGSTM